MSVTLRSCHLKDTIALQVTEQKGDHAGHTSTKAYVFQWNRNETKFVYKTNSFIGVPSPIDGKLYKEVKKTVWSNAPEDIPNFLSQFFNWTDSIIPDDAKYSTVVFFETTAGVKTSHYSSTDIRVEEDQIKPIFPAVLSYMNQSGVRFLQRESQLIKGSNEGIDGWISLNYLSRTLLNTPNTVGSIELSSTSSQITFAVAAEDFSNLRSGGVLVDFKNGNSWHLYSHTYPHHGIDTMRGYMEDEIRRTSASSKRVREAPNPCLPTGFNQTKVYSDNYVLTLYGTSSADECQQLIDAVINITDCGAANCGPGKVYQPDMSDISFIGFSVINYAVQFYYNTSNMISVDLEDLRVRSRKHCSAPLDTLKNVYGNTAYLDRYCFYGLYIHTLLSDGFNLKAFNSSNVINGVAVGWAPGAMMYEAMHVADNFTYCGDLSDCSSCLYHTNCGYCEASDNCMPAYTTCDADGWQKLESGGFCKSGDTPVRFIIAIVIGAAVLQIILTVGLVVSYRRWNAKQVAEITHMPLLDREDEEDI
ncbi:hypothetical protein PROFUN_02767 [Planoprotostelium fungivorum]|uniref:Uncharacterized protein n=1 Tax=Planoprotostelium fungivorum TaxID=1890364 RepID=A0A2P6NXI7_9EUKA|nr:hypothetical protein PROFUN_02767 [Planoprotostelium fungivorum]